MRYVALLRGVNVGGKNKLDMKQLVQVMTAAGFDQVSTYINTGNVFFTSKRSSAKLKSQLVDLLKRACGLDVGLLLKNQSEIERIVSAIPPTWQNDASAKCDVMFLWPRYDHENVLDQIKIKQQIDQVRYVSGAIIWRLDRQNIGQSGMMQLPGTDLYAHMTVRNCNTARKIAARLDSL